ncbi:MAG: flippase-like domain-containing protein [Candidatus Heimdallarchaeota archaeon]|nr:flippase-like domain-containing protein [Candidatus Heimdallarchaeota archaeon]
MDERGKLGIIRKGTTSKPFRIIRNVIAVVVTLGLLAYLIYYVKPKTFAETIIQIDPWILLLALFISVLMIFIKVIRWKYILGKLDINISFWKTLQFTFIGSFGAAVTPAKIGDVLRAFYLSKWTETKESSSVFSVILDRVMDLISISVFSIIALPFYFVGLESIIKWGIAGGLTIVAIVVFFTFNKQIIKKIVFLLMRLRRKKNTEGEDNEPRAIKYIDDYYSHLTCFNLRNYSALFLLSFLFWILLGTQVSLLIFSLSSTVMSFQNTLTIIGIMAIAAVVSLLPISLSGIGIRDLTITFLVYFSLLIQSEYAFSASIIQTVFNMLLPALIGGIFVLVLRRKKKRNNEL